MGTKIGLGFGLVVAIFTIVGVVSYASTDRLIAAEEVRTNKHEVIKQLLEVQLLIKDFETGQRGYILTGDPLFLEPFSGDLGELGLSRDALRQLTEEDPQQQRRLDTLQVLVRDFLVFAREGIDMRRADGLEAAVALIQTGRGRMLLDQIRGVHDDMRQHEEASLSQLSTIVERDARNARSTILLGTLAALVLAALAGFVITHNLSRLLGSLTKTAERITAGDLSARVAPDSRSDEVGVLARAFDKMSVYLQTMAEAAEQIAAGDLRTTITPQSPHDVLGTAFSKMTENLRVQTRELVEGANVLGSAAGEILAATTQLASSASQSATAVGETTTTVEEVRQTAEVSSQKARLVSDIAQKSAQISQSGRTSTEDVIAGMDRIRQQMEAIASSMARLNEQSHRIGQVIATVEDLSSQSNLLAVNAAIEAAKAGEHGKGFGVVATEVKRLAEHSREATDKVRTILDDIQKATAGAVLASEQGSKAVELGAKQTAVAGESIKALSGSVMEAAQAATQIAASSRQQLVGVDQVAAAMESIKQSSSQNVASARQLEDSARNLNDIGHSLQEIAGRYTF